MLVKNGHTTKYLNRVLAGAEYVVGALAAVGTLAIVSLFLLIMADVTCRFLLGFSISGGIEISEYLLIAFSFLLLGYAQLTGTHIRVEGIFSRVPARMQAVMNIFTLLVLTVLFSVMALQIGVRAYDAWLYKEFRPGVRFPLPTWPVTFLAFIGCVGLVMSFLMQLVHNIIGLTQGKVIGLKTWKLR